MQTVRLSPNRRREVEDSLIYSLNPEFENFLKHIDASPQELALLLDPNIRERVLLEVAGKGYKAIESERSKITGNLQMPQLVPDKPINYGGAEQDLMDYYSLARELDFEQTGNIQQETNSKNKIQDILSKKISELGKSGITNTAKGGINNIKHKKYGTRANHPELPKLSDEEAFKNTINQLTDNLLGNERGEQPAGVMSESGRMGGIPVEHKKDFENHPHLGFASENRMLGSSSKNSVVRAEQNPIRRQILLLSNMAEKEKTINEKYGMSVNELANIINYTYEPLNSNRSKFAGDEIDKLLKNREGRRQNKISETGGDDKTGEGNVYLG